MEINTRLNVKRHKDKLGFCSLFNALKMGLVNFRTNNKPAWESLKEQLIIDMHKFKRLFITDKK
jgi:hypothetical protein